MQRADPLEGGHPGGPERLVEGEVRLDRGRVRTGGLDDQHGEPLDAGEVAREARRQRVRDPGRGRGTGRCRRPPSAPRAARGSGSSRRRRRADGALDGAALGAGSVRARDRLGAGSWSAGTNQSGRDSPSSPDTSVRAVTSLTVQFGAAPSSRASLRSTIWPSDVEERDRSRRSATRSVPTTRRRSSPAAARARSRHRG